MKKRICHITSAHNSSDTRIFQKQCVSLAKEESFDVYLVARGESRTEKNVKVVGVEGSGFGRIKRILFFTRKLYVKALEIDADIYQIHDPELLPYALKLTKMGKKVIFDSHEDMFNQILIKNYLPKTIRKIIAHAYHAYETHVVKKLAAVLFPCPINGKHPFEGRNKNALFISNAPELGAVEWKKKNKMKMCYVGSLSENRGVTNLLKAYKNIEAKVPLVLAGKFESEEYEKYIRENGLLDGVDYRGYCTKEELQEIYNETTVGISNLLNVGQYPKLGTFPTKVFEYMEKGLGVIVSDYPFSRYVLTKYKIGILINPSNERDLTNAMDYMINNPEEVFSMGGNSRTLIEEEYNWQKEYKKLRNVYYQILNINN